MILSQIVILYSVLISVYNILTLYQGTSDLLILPGGTRINIILVIQIIITERSCFVPLITPNLV